MKKIFYAFVLVLLLASCQKEQAELSLSTPQNIVQNGEILTWDMVEGATFYTISFGNVVKKSFETTFSLLEFSNGTYDVKVMANTVSEQSDFSEVLEVTISRTYDIPQNLEFSEGIISWDEMINATSYNLKVNGVVIESDNNTHSLATISDTLYEVTVQAVYQSETSSWSNYISFHTYDVVGDSYQKQFNRLLPINLDLNLPYNIDIEAFYVDEETYSINHLTVDGLRISFDYSFLSTLNVGEHTITLITDAIRIDVLVNIFEEEDSSIVSSNTVDYQGTDITFSFMLFDSVIESINGSDITSNNYTINGDELTIKSAFIDALLLENPDRRTVIFSYTLASDENISIGYLFINTQTE